MAVLKETNPTELRMQHQRITSMIVESYEYAVVKSYSDGGAGMQAQNYV